MKEYDEIYESIESSFLERLSGFTFPKIEKYLSFEYEDYYPPYIKYRAKEALRSLRGFKTSCSIKFSENVEFFEKFETYFIRYMLDARGAMYYWMIKEFAKIVMGRAKDLLSSMSELRKEINMYINQYKDLKTQIINKEQLKESVEVAKLNGEDVSIESLKNKFEGNSYILSIINDLQICKHNSKRGVEYVDYQINNLRFILKALRNKEKYVHSVFDQYKEKFEFHKEKFIVWKEKERTSLESLVYYIKNSSQNQRKTFIEALDIYHEEHYSYYWILKWVQNQRHRMIEWYKK